MIAPATTPIDAAVEAAADEVQAPAEAPIAVTEELRAEGAGKRTGKAARTQAKFENVRDEAEANEERTEEMTTETNYFTALTAFPGAAAFEKLFADVAERSEEAVRRSRKAAEEFADIARSNVDAFVEAGKIATSGAQSIGQQMLAKSRDNIDHAANTVRALAEAKTPADVLQVQSEYVRGTFDRLVEETGTLTESLVKVAGEAFEPISTRASLNVERFNELVA